MPDTSPTNTSVMEAPAGHLSVYVEDQHPREIPFLFERQQKRMVSSVGVSFFGHLAAFVLVLGIIRFAPQSATSFAPQPTKIQDIVWLNQPGPGGGGGGGGNRMKEPPRKVELPGKEKLSVPVAKLPDVKPVPVEKPKDEPKPEEQLLSIPAKSMGAAEQTLPGTLEGTSTSGLSQGPGTGGGAGTGTGTGMGPGSGSGLGDGWGGGTGGGPYRPGSGIELPEVLREVKPQYTADAMRAKIQGVAIVECVVLPDGTVGQAQVVRSLDPVFGLDQEALKAARQWRFKPGRRLGQPVSVLVSIELTFTLR